MPTRTSLYVYKVPSSTNRESHVIISNRTVSRGKESERGSLSQNKVIEDVFLLLHSLANFDSHLATESNNAAKEGMCWCSLSMVLYCYVQMLQFIVPEFL